jgi:hypothetical protein
MIDRTSPWFVWFLSCNIYTFRLFNEATRLWCTHLWLINGLCWPIMYYSLKENEVTIASELQQYSSYVLSGSTQWQFVSLIVLFSTSIYLFIRKKGTVSSLYFDTNRMPVECDTVRRSAGRPGPMDRNRISHPFPSRREESRERQPGSSSSTAEAEELGQAAAGPGEESRHGTPAPLRPSPHLR